MPQVSFKELMEHAEQDGYAVGYFESWNLESLMAVADAAEKTRSPVLLGFSGIYLPHRHRVRREPLQAYAAMGLAVCRSLSVPAALVFNECPYDEVVRQAVDLGFSLVMYSDEAASSEAQLARVQQIARIAHQKGVAVEGEAKALPGVGGDLGPELPNSARLTEVQPACTFVEQTGVDAFAVNIGQMHFHGRRMVRLDLERLQGLKAALGIPLVLHGASSVTQEDLQAAIQRGIRKINVGSILKQVYFQALKEACLAVEPDANPYEIIGSGLKEDVLISGRMALQEKTEEFMNWFGSSGKARAWA